MAVAAGFTSVAKASRHNLKDFTEEEMMAITEWNYRHQVLMMESSLIAAAHMAIYVPEEECNDIKDAGM